MVRGTEEFDAMWTKTEEYFRDFKGKLCECEEIKMKYSELDDSLLVTIMEYPRLKIVWRRRELYV